MPTQPANTFRARIGDSELSVQRYGALAQTPVDERFGADLAEIRASEAQTDDPWPSG